MNILKNSKNIVLFTETASDGNMYITTNEFMYAPAIASVFVNTAAQTDESDRADNARVFRATPQLLEVFKYAQEISSITPGVAAKIDRETQIEELGRLCSVAMDILSL